ncbi:hypothetical protein [Pontibacter rugosus]
MYKLFKPLAALILSLMVVLSSCTATREQQIEDDMSDFRTWVSNNTSNIADRSEEDWHQTKETFKTRTQELDQKEDKLSARLKQDYKELKQQFNSADATYTRNQQNPGIAEWERALLGSWADYASINASNVREAYITFMENVRDQKSNWGMKIGKWQSGARATECA